MTDKTEAQPEALRLAEFYTMFNDGMSTAAASELRRQHAEIERLRALAATCYAGLGGECDLPVIWLDALSDAANGEPFDTDGLLPYTSAIRAQLVAQTNRAASAEQQVTALTHRLDMANRLNTGARNQLAQLSARQAAPDGWRLVPVDFVRGFGNLAHNYSLQAIAPDYYWGNERSAFTDAYARCGHDLAELKALLSAAPPPPEQEPLTQEQKDAVIQEWIMSRVQGATND